MKKRLNIALCIVLALTMLLALTGCSKNDNDKLVGSWKCELDLADALNDELYSADEEMAEYLSVDEFVLVLYMDFNADDTYSLKLDEQAMDAAMNDFVEIIKEGMYRYLEDMIFEQTGMEMTADEILEMSGMNMDDLMASLDVESLVDEMAVSMEQEGKFMAKDGKLYTSAGLEYEVDPTMYETYTLEGNTLTLLEFHGADDIEDVMDIYPMVLEKVG